MFCVLLWILTLLVYVMSEAWWLERVKGTNTVKLFVDDVEKGEVEYVVPRVGSGGNKTVDVSESFKILFYRLLVLLSLQIKIRDLGSVAVTLTGLTANRTPSQE